MSLYTTYPLRINNLSYQSYGYGWRFRYPEYSKHKYPNKRIFENHSIWGSKLTENERFIKLVERNLSYSGKRGASKISFEEVEYSLTGKEYIDFAIQLYNQANQIPLNNPNAKLNKKTKLTLYISSLESLFNISPIQASHTLARHYSIILWNPKSFIVNYKLMKLYYELRSKFVHGASNTNMKAIDNKILSKSTSLGLVHPRNLSDVLDELDSKIKFIINLVMQENKSKEDLFVALNTRGQDPSVYYKDSPVSPTPY